MRTQNDTHYFQQRRRSYAPSLRRRNSRKRNTLSSTTSARRFSTTSGGFCRHSFHGNSLTNGGEWDELLGMPNAVNRGISGDTTEGIADRLGSITRGKPAKIFLMAGVNDVSHDIPADSVAQSVLALIERIHAESPSTKVYLQSLLPINNSFGRYKRVFGKEQVIRDINTILAANAEARRCNVDKPLSPLHRFRRQPASRTYQRRPSPPRAGYIIWRDIIKPYVTE